MSDKEDLILSRLNDISDDLIDIKNKIKQFEEFMEHTRSRAKILIALLRKML